MEDEEDFIVLIVGDNSEISNSSKSFEEFGVSLNTQTAEFAETFITRKDFFCQPDKSNVTCLNLQETINTRLNNIDFFDTVEIKVEKTEFECDLPLKELDESTPKQNDETGSNAEKVIDYIFKTEIKVEHNVEDKDESKKDTKCRNSPKLLKCNEAKKVKKIGHKFMKPISEHISFVNELRCQFPELEQDEELLISTLANIMKNIKTPIPPADCYHIDGVKYKCSICGLLSDTKWKAKVHYQYIHGPRYLICFACGTDFRCIVTLYEHEKRCCNPDAVIVLKARAQIIGEKARNRPYLDIEKRREEISKEKKKKSIDKPRHVCSECNVEFSSKLSLERHTLLHRGLRPFPCSICAATYSSSQGLKRHMKSHLNEEYICDICKKSFKVKSCLVLHIGTHFPQSKFECIYCGKRYSKKMDLTTHVDTVHLNQPRPHACPICNKGFLRLSTLQYHMRHKHGMTIITRKALLRQLPTLSEEKNDQFVKSAVMVKHVDGTSQIVSPR